MSRQELVDQYGHKLVDKYHKSALQYAQQKGFTPNNEWALTAKFIKNDYANGKSETEQDGVTTRVEEPAHWSTGGDTTFEELDAHYDDAQRVLAYMNRMDKKIYNDAERYSWDGHKEWRGIAHLIAKGETADDLIYYCQHEWPCHTKLCRAVGLKLHRTGAVA